MVSHKGAIIHNLTGHNKLLTYCMTMISIFITHLTVLYNITKTPHDTTKLKHEPQVLVIFHGKEFSI